MDNNVEPVQTHNGPSNGKYDYQYTVEKSGHVKFRVWNDGTINSATYVTITSITSSDGTEYKIN